MYNTGSHWVLCRSVGIHLQWVGGEFKFLKRAKKGSQTKSNVYYFFLWCRKQFKKLRHYWYVANILNEGGVEPPKPSLTYVPVYIESQSRLLPNFQQLFHLLHLLVTANLNIIFNDRKECNVIWIFRLSTPITRNYLVETYGPLILTFRN